VLLAEVEAFFSRPIAPTRRVALGRLELPTDPAPGYGGILLASIAAAHAPLLDDDFEAEARALMNELERGRRISQPRLRHRLQEDRIGLQRCTHRLIGDESGALRFDLDDEVGTPAQHVLCALYAAGRAPRAVRHEVMAAVRTGFSWGWWARAGTRGAPHRPVGGTLDGGAARSDRLGARRARPAGTGAGDGDRSESQGRAASLS
jgi:hypothetical protein